MLAVLAREFEAECLFQRGAQRSQARQISLRFDARFGIACVRGKKPRYFLGRGKRRGLQQQRIAPIKKSNFFGLKSPLGWSSYTPRSLVGRVTSRELQLLMPVSISLKTKDRMCGNPA
jgi:hypothetical protein